MNNLRHPFRAAALAALLCLALAPPTALAQFSYNGNNYTTLYAAFTAMNGASGTITVTSDGSFGNHNQTCEITNGQHLILKSDTQGVQRTITPIYFSEARRFGCFVINDGGTLTVKDIVVDFLRASYSTYPDIPYGYFIVNHSANTITLDNCTIQNCTGNGLMYYNENTAAPIRSVARNVKLTISCPNGLKFDNIADYIAPNSLGVYGGCIYGYSDIEINGDITCSKIGSRGRCAQSGGAIYSRTGSITINGNASFYKCWAKNSGAALVANNNGAITINGNHCKFEECYFVPERSSCSGGAIALFSAVGSPVGGDLTINANATFINCGGTYTGSGYSTLRGGGISCAGNVTITGNATFSGCIMQAPNFGNPGVTLNPGGGIYAYEDVTIGGNATFTDNEAGNGGGIYTENGDVKIIGDALFENNKAGGYPVAFDRTVNGNGGAISTPNGAISILGEGGATFKNCQAYSCIMSDRGRGGAIYTVENLNIPNGATFIDCRANDFEAHGGGICFGGDIDKVVTGDMSFIDCHSDGKGGGMSLLSGELTINGNVTGSGCTAANGSGGCVFTDAPMTINGTVNIDDCESTEFHGGGLAALHGTVTANGTVTITNCTARVNGGGIYAESTVTLNATGNTITGNTATNGNGGGIFCTGGLIKNTTLGGNAANKNTAGNNGGGIFNNGGTLAFESNQNHVTHNQANNNGGGIYNNNGGTINFNADPNVSDNQADNDGGGIYNATDGTLNFNAPMDINNNTATNNGGGVFNNGTFNSTGTTALAIEGNQADNGGGIYNTKVLTMTSSGTQTIARNTATNNGGGIWTNGMGGTLIPVEVEETVYGVEYIEVQTEQISAGIPSSVAYINTGITFSGDHKTWARGQRAGGELFMFYAYTSNNERAGYKVLSGNIQRVWPDVTNSGQSYQGTIASLIDNPIEVEQDASHITITVSDGTSNTFNYSGNTSGTVSNTWTLLRPYAINSACKGRLFEAKIWDGSGTLIGHYIPCRRASGELGVYDVVTKKFRGNAGGSSFTAGAETGQTYIVTSTTYVSEFANVVTLNNITIGGSAADKNTATNGAGIYVEGNGITLGNNCTVSYNEASNNGGGVYNNTSATVAFSGTNTNIDYNKANNNGGGLYNTSTLEYDNDNAGFTAQHNSANDGGGVYADGQGNTTLLQNAIVKDNTATRNGGGGYVNTNAIMQLDGFSTTGVLFQQNHAGTHGGGIYKLGTLKVQGLIDITENTAGQ